jgi:hypothetical protein
MHGQNKNMILKYQTKNFLETNRLKNRKNNKHLY